MSGSDLWAAVLAGGFGTRLWPLNRDGWPKYLLTPPGHGRTLLGDALARTVRVCGEARIVLLASARQLEQIRAHCPEAARVHILEEPARKDTVAAIALAAAFVWHRTGTGDSRLLTVPTDQLVEDHDAFAAAVTTAAAGLADDEADIVLLGVKPLGPSLEYGYLRPTADGRLRALVEKPDATEATKLLGEAGTLWNTGLAVARTGFVVEAVARRFPVLRDALMAIVAGGTGDREVVTRLYRSADSMSFERGVLARVTEEEKRRVAVQMVPFVRHDFGGYEGLHHALAPDARGNSGQGDVDFRKTTRSLAIGPAGKKLALLGVDDLIVVDHGDVTVVVSRDRLDLLVDYVRELRRDGSPYA